MLGKSLRLRNAPEVHFKADESIARASRIEQLLAQVRNEREAEAAVSVDAVLPTASETAAADQPSGDASVGN
jgi:hypothetical protein